VVAAIAALVEAVALEVAEVQFTEDIVILVAELLDKVIVEVTKPVQMLLVVAVVVQEVSVPIIVVILLVLAVRLNQITLLVQAYQELGEAVVVLDQTKEQVILVEEAVLVAVALRVLEVVLQLTLVLAVVAEPLILTTEVAALAVLV